MIKLTKPFLILTLALFLFTVASPPMKRFLAASPSAQTNEGDDDVDAILDESHKAVRTSLGYQIYIDSGTKSYDVLTKSENESESHNPVVRLKRKKCRYRVRFSYANKIQEGVIHQNEELKITSITAQILSKWEFNEDHGCVTVGGNKENQIFKFVEHPDPDDSGAYAIVCENIYLGLSEETGFLEKNAFDPLKVKFGHCN